MAGPVISRAELEEMFDAMRAKRAWDIEGPCLWGYFFADYDRAKLEAASSKLEAAGYRAVGIMGPSDENDDRLLLFLHVERREKHSVDTLHARNQELYRFASENGLKSYDGMDVGPVSE